MLYGGREAECDMSYNLYIETPVCPCCGKQEHVEWSWQITWNFSGIIRHLDLGPILSAGSVVPVKDALPKLKKAIETVVSDFAFYEGMQSRYNGWGSASDFEQCLRDLITQCERYPDGIIECSN